jgi:hypothetical protein
VASQQQQQQQQQQQPACSMHFAWAFVTHAVVWLMLLLELLLSHAMHIAYTFIADHRQIQRA